MLELISHHRFRQQGVPVDISRYGNHGRAHGTTAVPGREPSSTAIKCREGAAVLISPAAGQWSPLVALRIDVVVRMESLDSGPMVLVEIANVCSFRMVEWHLEALLAAAGGEGVGFMTPRPVWRPGPPSGPTWRTLTFDHDGYSKIELRVDDAVVGQKATSLPVVAAGPSPIAIGNHLAGTMPFSSAIDEVKVWRQDPTAMQQEFFCRPLSTEAAACWAALFKRLQEWGRTHPEEFRALGQLVQQLERAFVGALFNLPSHVQEELRKLVDDFTRLWCCGEIGGKAMRSVLERLVAILRAHGLEALVDRFAAAIRPLLGLIPIDPKQFACDPSLGEFIGLLTDVAGPGGAAA